MKIIFLDVDGPLIPLRLHKQWGHVFVYDKIGGYYLWDNEFCQELNSICEEFEAKIVFNSSHNTSGAGVLRVTAKANGIDQKHLHDDTCTKYPDIEQRPHAIYDWLDRNVPFGSSCDWIVIDDFELPVGNHLVNVTLEQGIHEKHIEEIRDKFTNHKNLKYYNEAPTGE